VRIMAVLLCAHLSRAAQRSVRSRAGGEAATRRGRDDPPPVKCGHCRVVECPVRAFSLCRFSVSLSGILACSM